VLPQNFHLQKVGKRGRFTIWRVDGIKIRSFLDPEFTNFGQHFRFPYIPEQEFWLDCEVIKDERRFFIDHLLVEWKLMKQGISYDLASITAGIKEKAERYRSLTVKKLILTEKAFDINKLHTKLLEKTNTGLSVWIVNGNLVRTLFFIDFTEGGHHYVYDFVPENEIWIDNDLLADEIPFVILHEFHEMKLMKKLKWVYAKAHRHASRLEWLCRQGLKDVSEELAKFGWKQKLSLISPNFLHHR
jgi:hypothetical protein